MKDKQFSQAAWLVMLYAERKGWIPIGHRVWMVGEWRIEVNGTRDQIGNVPPFHMLVENTRYLGTMLMQPYGGKIGGYKDTEREFVQAMTPANEKLKKEKSDAP